MGQEPTGILIIQLEEITFLKELIRVAIQEVKNWLKLRNGIFGDIHNGRDVGHNHRQWS